MTTTQVPVAVAEPTRISSIDIVRGAVMVLMAIDHVRVYSGLPAGGPTAGIFFTRWVTHFCAPAFIFLAGTSAFMYAQRHGDVRRFLLTRGLWLVLLELTVLRVAWTFNFEFMRYDLAGVIWVIGWCMVLLALLVRLPLTVIASFGLVVIAGHNLLDPFLPTLVPTLAESGLSGLLEDSVPRILGRTDRARRRRSCVLGAVFDRAVGRRHCRRLRVRRRAHARAATTQARLLCHRTRLRSHSFSCCADSISTAIRGRGSRGLEFLNTTKYPASLSFLLMTLGPTIALMPLLDARAARSRGGSRSSAACRSSTTCCTSR